MSLEEPLVPIRLDREPPKPVTVKSVLERTGAVLLVRNPTSYLRSVVGLLVNVVLAVSGPIGLLLHEGKVSGWQDLGAFPVAVSLLPTVAAVVRQWLHRSPGDVEGGNVRDAIRGK